MDQHPTIEDFEALFGKGSRPAHAPRRSRALRHLLAGCPSCQETVRTIHQQNVPRGEGTDQSKSFEYDEVFQRAERDFELFLVNGCPVEEPPGSLLAELFPSPAEGELRFSDARFTLPLLIKWLVALSYEERFDDPERMLELALMARLAADACTPEVARSRERLADLRGRAWVQLGSSLRIFGRLREAEGALATAGEHFSKGTGDPALWAILLEHIASLHIDSRSFQSAIDLLKEAKRTYYDLGERSHLARTLVLEGVALEYSGNPDAAIHLLHQTLPLIDSQEDSCLQFMARHNLADCYIRKRTPQQATQIYRQVRTLRKTVHDKRLLLQNDWQEGELLRSLAHFQGAETAFLRARAGFIEQGLPYHMAVVSLDLALVYQELGDLRAMNRTLEEALVTFRSLRIPQESVASFLAERSL